MSDVSLTTVRPHKAMTSGGWVVSVAQVLGLFLTCVVFAALGAVALDRLTTRSEEEVQPPFEDPVWMPSLVAGGDDDASTDGTQFQAAEAGLADPGGVIELEHVPGVEGLPADEWVLDTAVVLPEGATTTTTTVPSPDATVPPSDTTTPSAETSVPSPEAVAPTQPSVPADQAAAVAKQWGETSVQGVPVVKRFVDQCAEGLGVCPAGEPGTVVPFEGSAAPPALEIKLWPGLTKAVAPSLRCDPGYVTTSRLPVVVTANRPLYSLTLELSVPGVGTLDSVKKEFTWQESEADWWQSRTSASPPQPVGTDLGNGTQYCLWLRSQGDPTVAAKLSGATLPAPLVDHLEASAVQKFGNDYTPVTAKADFPAPALTVSGTRPPVTLTPLNGNVLQVVVPQRTLSTGSPTVVATSHYLGCAGSKPEATPGTVSDQSVGTPYDPAQLASADYPYDRAYTGYTVVNLVLQSYNSYEVCVFFPDDPPPDDVSKWQVSPPRAMLVKFLFGDLRPTEAGRVVGGVSAGYYPAEPWSPRGGLELYTTNPGCNTLYPGRFLEDPAAGFPVEFCPSEGNPYPMITTFEMLVFDQSSQTVVDKGAMGVFTPTWCEPVTPPSPTGFVTTNWAYVMAEMLCGMGPLYQPVTFVWRDQNVLCGGECSDKHTLAYLDAHRYSSGLSPETQRRGQLDWLISQQVSAIAPEAP